MQLLPIKYSTFKAVAGDLLATQVEESWQEFAERLLTHTVTPNKTDVELFSGATFVNSGRRAVSNVDEICFFSLDFDNGHTDLKTKQKVRVDNPLDPSEVEMILAGWEFVITTTHNHTPEWPRFRVVMPLAQPIQLKHWHAFAAYVSETLGLSVFVESKHLDKICDRVDMSYYWPSCPEGSEPYAQWHEGAPLEFDTSVELAIRAKRKASGKAQGFSLWSLDQISMYWNTEDPEIFQDPNADEWRYNCAIHGGDSYKLYVNALSGNWCCQSGCSGAGGDIYEYHRRKHKLTWRETQEAVHRLIGAPANEYAQTELAAIIDEAEVHQVAQLSKAIAQHKGEARKQLKKQLITRFPEISKTEVADHIKAADNSKKIVSLFPADAEENNATFAEPDGYGLKLDRGRWSMGPEGIFTVSQNRNGDTTRMPITDRPMWPSAQGYDMKTSKTYLQLTWVGSKGRVHQEWLDEGITRNKLDLAKLDDTPISLLNMGHVSAFLTHAKAASELPEIPLASATGWYELDDTDPESIRFVFPGDPMVGYVGPKLKSRGTVDAWKVGLEAILALGQDGYRSLAVVAISAASPIIQLLNGKRSPIFGLIHESSTGKGKSIEYALSIWDKPQALMASARASNKGAEDLMHQKNGLPICYDEIQHTYDQRGPEAVEAILYGQANNQGRLTATAGRKHIGGEERYHATLFAAERNVMYGLQVGAQNRAICLIGDAPPLGDENTVRMVERATVHNFGVIGPRIVEILNEYRLETVAEVETCATEIYSRRAGTKGDDHYYIAMAVQGLKMLEEITGVAIPIDDFADWLLKHAKRNRLNTRTSTENAFMLLLETIFGMTWSASDKHNVLHDLNGAIAFRDTHLSCAVENRLDTPLEIHPTHPTIVKFLQGNNLTEAVAQDWIKKGWLKPQNRHPKWLRGAKQHTPGAYVWRVTKKGLAMIESTQESSDD